MIKLLNIDTLCNSSDQSQKRAPLADTHYIRTIIILVMKNVVLYSTHTANPNITNPKILRKIRARKKKTGGEIQSEFHS